MVSLKNKVEVGLQLQNFSCSLVLFLQKISDINLTRPSQLLCLSVIAFVMGTIWSFITKDHLLKPASNNLLVSGQPTAHTGSDR